MTARPSLAWKITVLTSLYFVQGLPAGFQTTALPTYLREQGLSLSAIGFLGFLALPWSLKVLWAPLVDAYHLPWLGRRRSWILPMQGALAAACFAAAMVPMPDNLATFLALVLLMNLFAATMDIAVDGLAVDLLEPDELGHGNSSQVNGYKVGMLTGGGLLLWLSGTASWRPLLLAMGAMVSAVMFATLFWSEPAPRAPLAEGAPPYRASAEDAPVDEGPREGPIARVLRLLRRTLSVPGTGWLLLYVATYKTGESLVDVMYKPFLVDAGFGSRIGLWLGTYGMIASLLGSLLGGWLASRGGIWQALLVATALRAGPVFGEWWLAMGHATETSVLVVTIAEHFFGGVLTTVVFAFMMAQVDPRIGGTHFTLLATLEVLGKAPAGPIAGLFAQSLGYSTLFAVGSFLSLAVILVVLPLRRRAALVPGAGVDEAAG